MNDERQKTLATLFAALAIGGVSGKSVADAIEAAWDIAYRRGMLDAMDIVDQKTGRAKC